MINDHWEKIKQIFAEALELNKAEREAYLQDVCGEDQELLEEIYSLLEAYNTEGPLSQSLEQLRSAVFSKLNTQLQEESIEGDSISHYEILEKLGGGGMGIVYRARDTRLNRSVAIKFLPPALSINTKSKDRFAQDAKAAAALDHPNIAVIHDIDETRDGRPFIAMAYYKGETLKEKIAGSPLPIDEALSYAIQIAQGLKKAHSADIVHRDIKPANVMITEEGGIKILDFGLAKLEGAAGLTKTGATIGTPHYMSPEQARGEEVDSRTDIWSLGVVLYEMLTGQRPFRGEHGQAVLYSILNDKPEPPANLRAEIPEELAQTVLVALDKDRKQRISSAKEVLKQLDDLRAEEEMPSAALSSIEQLARKGDYATAYRLADQLETHLEDNPKLARLMPDISDTLTVLTEPKGARVYLQRFVPDEEGQFPDSVLAGKTPIRNLRIARSDYRITIEKEGYATLERMASSALNRVESSFGVAPEITIEARLIEKEKVPEDMVFVPGVNTFYEQSVPEQAEWLLSPHIKAGRAVLAVVFKGMIERKWAPSRLFPDPESVRFRDLMVRHATELSRGLDYLETRDEVDTDRMAYVGFSWRAASRLVFAAVEDRYRSIVLIGGGIDDQYQPTRPETSTVNFAPYIEPPVLMLNGRYDEEIPYNTGALPLWNLLSEKKKLARVEGGHFPSLEARVSIINRWLDETLGSVRLK